MFSTHIYASESGARQEVNTGGVLEKKVQSETEVRQPWILVFNFPIIT